jgi:hypothetical protein
MEERDGREITDAPAECDKLGLDVAGGRAIAQ